MFLSFIIPIYNVKDYLGECIDSLLNQDIDDYEIILVDDGSTDGSSEICDEYIEKSSRIKVIHKPNGGLADARNCGIRSAKGEYLGFVDGDDFIEQNCLENICSEIKAQKNPDLLFMKAYKYEPNRDLILLDENYDKTQIVGCDRDDVITYIAGRRKYPGSACTKLVRKKLVMNNDIFFEVGRLSEDLDWVKKILFTAKSFGYYEESYYYYRQRRKGSISNSVSKKSYFDRMDLYDRWLDELRESNNSTELNAMKNFVGYEYKVMMGDLYCLNKEDLAIALNWIKNNAELLSYRNDRQTILIRTVCAVMGIKNTCKLLNEYKRTRR